MPSSSFSDRLGFSLSAASMSYLWIALGSAIGGVLRFWLSSAVAQRLDARFGEGVGLAFVGTVVVNVTGCFAIGLLAGMGPVPFTRQLFMIGLLGGYTTFSSFSLQTLELAHEGKWFMAGMNVLLSVVLSLIAVWAGHALGAALKR